MSLRKVTDRANLCSSEAVGGFEHSSSSLAPLAFSEELDMQRKLELDAPISGLSMFITFSISSLRV